MYQTLPTACGFLRLPQVLSLYPVSKSTWWKGVAEGRYPKPVKLGERATAWRTEDIFDLIEATTTKDAA
ncbi:AlpA family phage regulatory protein [Lysobacter sp. FW306-1B-D06B]|uniref:helix-turn-helix transcriptional regulator n=1 Tax=Lysobacter sp. FW306-1B-D06B TaxID=3140250 RepID=UPI003140876A